MPPSCTIMANKFLDCTDDLVFQDQLADRGLRLARRAGNLPAVNFWLRRRRVTRTVSRQLPRSTNMNLKEMFGA